MIVRALIIIILLAAQTSWASKHEDPRVHAATATVVRISGELESGQPIPRNPGDFDPLEGTRNILAILRNVDNPEKPFNGEESNPTDRRGRADFVRAALASRGAPYVWGGTTSGGFDCSGLIQTVARRFGMNLPRTAAQQWERGTPVDRASLKPGDLVFFADTYKPGISHVGIYTGEGRFVHASSAQGKVTVSSLSESYFTRKYAGARRLNLPMTDSADSSP